MQGGAEHAIKSSRGFRPDHEFTTHLSHTSTLSSQQSQQPTSSPLSDPEINRPHQESLFTMNTNRDQAVQAAIGGSVIDLVKNGVFLAGILGSTIVITTIIVKFTARPDVNTGTMLGLMTASFCIVAYLILGTNAGPVCAKSTHYVLMICGSGGHTAEMIQMVERSIRSEKSSHRRWAVGKDDEKSYEKVLTFERRLLDRFSHHNLDSGTFDVVRFGRARYVHQSWLTTPFTVIFSLLDIIRILITPPRQQPHPGLRYPGVVVTNGPGTGFLFLLVARALKVIRVVPASHMRGIYVESWARVKSLSLTGKLIRKLRLADLFIVQSRFVTGPNEVLAENLLVRPQQPHVPFNV
jgi:hypothetical protein